MNAETYLSQARRPDGSIRPLSEILDAEQRARFAARSAELLAKQEAASKRTDTQKLVDGTQQLYDHARKNDDRSGAKFYKAQLDLAKQKLAGEQAAEAKRKLFANDRRIQLIREEATLIERSGAHLLPHASQVELDNLVGLARSEDWPDPASQFQAYRELSDRLTDAEIVAEQQKQSAAQVEAARQELTAAQSRVQESELQIMRARREGVANE